MATASAGTKPQTLSFFFSWYTFSLYLKVINAHPLTLKKPLFLGHFSSLWCTFSMHKTSKSSRAFQASDLWIHPSCSTKWCNKTSILTSTYSRTVFVIFILFAILKLSSLGHTMWWLYLHGLLQGKLGYLSWEQIPILAPMF